MTSPGGIPILSRDFRFFTYHNTFNGKDLCKWLKANKYVSLTFEKSHIKIFEKYENI